MFFKVIKRGWRRKNRALGTQDAVYLDKPTKKQTNRQKCLVETVLGKKKPLMKISGKKEQRIFESVSTSGLYRMSVSSVHM